jgi:hypothetical protein
MRPSAVVAVVFAAVGVVGCAPIDQAADSSLSRDPSGLSGQSASNMVAVPVEEVGSCVAQIKFGAYVGDTTWGEIWNQAGQSDTAATAYCSGIGSSEPARLRAIHEAWLPVEASIAAAQAAEQAAPVEVAAPAPACDSNYEGCVPIASDVDCEGGDGDGPAYVAGPLRVIGTDHYGLDRDGDGWAC